MERSEWDEIYSLLRPVEAQPLILMSFEPDSEHQMKFDSMAWWS